MPRDNEIDVEPNASRRDFLKLATASLGGALLAGTEIGCGGSTIFAGGSGNGLNTTVGRGQIPNAYTFYRVFTPGAGPILPEITSLTGGVTNNDSTIVFHALGPSGQPGIYRLDMSYSGTSKPGFTDAPSVVVRQGDQLPGGISVGSLGSWAIGNGGASSTLALVITVSDNVVVADGTPLGSTPMLWKQAAGQFLPVLEHYDDSPTGGHFGAHIGDVAVNARGDILFNSDYYDPVGDAHDIAEGLFLVPGGSSVAQGVLLARTGVLLQGANSAISQFGICDLDDDGHYVFQAFSRSGFGAVGASSAVSAGIFGGQVGGHAALVAGSVGNSLSGPTSGTAFLGPRVRDGDHTEVLHTDAANTQQTLLFNGIPVTNTGSLSPDRHVINGLGPGCISNHNIYFLATVDNGMELIASNGVKQKTILKYGDHLPNNQGEIRGIVHGFHSDQADSMGRLVFVGEFADGSQSIVVGIPS